MEAGSYWQSCYVSLVGDGSPNSVHTALTSPHCTVENILDSEDVFQELKSYDALLVNFLTRRSTLHRLVAYSTQLPPPDATEAQCYKYPFVSCELLCSDAPSIVSCLIEAEYQDVLDALWSFLTPSWHRRPRGRFYSHPSSSQVLNERDNSKGRTRDKTSGSSLLARRCGSLTETSRTSTDQFSDGSGTFPYSSQRPSPNDVADNGSTNSPAAASSSPFDNPVLCGYFCRIVTALLEREGVKLAEYLRKKPVLVYNLINCIHSRSIAEVVQYCLLVEAPEKTIFSPSRIMLTLLLMLKPDFQAQPCLAVSPEALLERQENVSLIIQRVLCENRSQDSLYYGVYLKSLTSPTACKLLLETFSSTNEATFVSAVEILSNLCHLTCNVREALEGGSGWSKDASFSATSVVSGDDEAFMVPSTSDVCLTNRDGERFSLCKPVNNSTVFESAQNHAGRLEPTNHDGTDIKDTKASNTSPFSFQRSNTPQNDYNSHLSPPSSGEAFKLNPTLQRQKSRRSLSDCCFYGGEQNDFPAYMDCPSRPSSPRESAFALDCSLPLSDAPSVPADTTGNVMGEGATSYDDKDAVGEDVTEHGDPSATKSRPSNVRQESITKKCKESESVKEKKGASRLFWLNDSFERKPSSPSDSIASDTQSNDPRQKCDSPPRSAYSFYNAVSNSLSSAALEEEKTLESQFLENDISAENNSSMSGDTQRKTSSDAVEFKEQPFQQTFSSLNEEQLFSKPSSKVASDAIWYCSPDEVAGILSTPQSLVYDGEATDVLTESNLEDIANGLFLEQHIAPHFKQLFSVIESSAKVAAAYALSCRQDSGRERAGSFNSTTGGNVSQDEEDGDPVACSNAMLSPLLEPSLPSDSLSQEVSERPIQLRFYNTNASCEELGRTDSQKEHDVFDSNCGMLVNAEPEQAAASLSGGTTSSSSETMKSLQSAHGPSAETRISEASNVLLPENDVGLAPKPLLDTTTTNNTEIQKPSISDDVTTPFSHPAKLEVVVLEKPVPSAANADLLKEQPCADHFSLDKRFSQLDTSESKCEAAASTSPVFRKAPSAISTSSICLQNGDRPRVGIPCIVVLHLVKSLLRRTLKLNSMITTSFFLECLVTLFFAHRWNTMLHICIGEILQSIVLLHLPLLTLSYKQKEYCATTAPVSTNLVEAQQNAEQVLGRLLRNTSFLDELVRFFRRFRRVRLESEVHYRREKRLRLLYGQDIHAVHTATLLCLKFRDFPPVALCSVPLFWQDIQSVLQNTKGWNDIVRPEVAFYTSLLNIPLGGGVPSDLVERLWVAYPKTILPLGLGCTLPSAKLGGQEVNTPCLHGSRESFSFVSLPSKYTSKLDLDLLEPADVSRKLVKEEQEPERLTAEASATSSVPPLLPLYTPERPFLSEFSCESKTSSTTSKPLRVAGGRRCLASTVAFNAMLPASEAGSGGVRRKSDTGLGRTHESDSKDSSALLAAFCDTPLQSLDDKALLMIFDNIESSTSTDFWLRSANGAASAQSESSAFKTNVAFLMDETFQDLPFAVSSTERSHKGPVDSDKNHVAEKSEPSGTPQLEAEDKPPSNAASESHSVGEDKNEVALSTALPLSWDLKHHFHQTSSFSGLLRDAEERVAALWSTEDWASTPEEDLKKLLDGSFLERSFMATPSSSHQPAGHISESCNAVHCANVANDPSSSSSSPGPEPSAARSPGTSPSPTSTWSSSTPLSSLADGCCAPSPPVA